MTTSNRIDLSPSGRNRRDRMLTELQREVRANHQRKKIRDVRWKVATLLLLGAPLLWLAWSGAEQQMRKPAENDVAINPEFSPYEAFVIRTRPIAVGDFVVTNKTEPKLEFSSLSDDEMLQWMADHREPSELVTIDGQLTVVPSRPSL